MADTLSVKTNKKCLLCDFAWQFKTNKQTTVQFWEKQFLTDKLILFSLRSEDHKIPRPISFPRLQVLEKLIPFPQTFKDHVNPAVSLSTDTSLLIFTLTPEAGPTCHQPAVHTAEECAIQHLVPAPPLRPPPRST